MDLVGMRTRTLIVVVFSALSLAACASDSLIPRETAEVREVWGDRIRLRQDNYYDLWYVVDQVNEARDGSLTRVFSPLRFESAFFVERLGSRDDIPGEYWENAVLGSTAVLPIGQRILDIAATHNWSNALYLVRRHLPGRRNVGNSNLSDLIAFQLESDTQSLTE